MFHKLWASMAFLGMESKIYVGISVEIMYNENVYVYTYGKRKSIEGDSIMFDNQRKNICVVLCDVAEHYQEQVCRVLTSNARVVRE